MSLVQRTLLCLQYGKPPLEDGLLAPAIMILVDNKGSAMARRSGANFRAGRQLFNGEYTNVRTDMNIFGIHDVKLTY